MKDKSLILVSCSLALLLSLLVACDEGPPTATPVPSTAAPFPAATRTPSAFDYWPTTDWRTSTPEEQGMDSELLVKKFDFIREQKEDLHSLTIIRNGTRAPLPQTAQRVSGLTYELDPNLLGYQSVSLTFQEEAQAMMNLTADPDQAERYLVDTGYWRQGQWPIRTSPRIIWRRRLSRRE